MQFSLLIYQPDDDFQRRDDPARCAAFWGAWLPYIAALREAGVFVGGTALERPAEATVVRLRQGQRLVEDGPYADTKEQLGGVIMIDVPDIAAAVAWMWRCPAIHTGVVELRPNLPPVATLIATAKADALAG
ncbi:MAG TPA: YciI family protein [Dongiaceae bacterium]